MYNRYVTQRNVVYLVFCVTCEAAMTKNISKEYVIGLVEAEGNFSFSVWKAKERKIPSFQLKMHVRDAHLVELVRDAMGLSNKIYTYGYQRKDGTGQNSYSMFIVREIGGLKNIVVPFFYDQFKGHKDMLFREWLDQIGSDPWVPDSYKVIYRLHKNGFYRKNSKFG